MGQMRVFRAPTVAMTAATNGDAADRDSSRMVEGE